MFDLMLIQCVQWCDRSWYLIPCQSIRFYVDRLTANGLWTMTIDDRRPTFRRTQCTVQHLVKKLFSTFFSPHQTIHLGFDLVAVDLIAVCSFRFLFSSHLTEKSEEAKLVFFFIFHKPYLISTALCYRDVSFLYYVCLLAS